MKTIKTIKIISLVALFAIFANVVIANSNSAAYATAKKELSEAFQKTIKKRLFETVQFFI